MVEAIKKILPLNVVYVGDFYKDGDYYYFTIKVPKYESVDLSTTQFEILSIENDICVYVKLRIGVDYLNYLMS
ncbi:hypothetical protein [Soonwooa purpurea]